MASALVTRTTTAGKVGEQPEAGLRQRKKARLRQQIIGTSIKLFRRHGYDDTRIDDIVQVLEISQPTFFRYFPSKDAVLREVGERGYAVSASACAWNCRTRQGRRSACADST